jgi:hypothetical protein
LLSMTWKCSIRRGARSHPEANHTPLAAMASTASLARVQHRHFRSAERGILLKSRRSSEASFLRFSLPARMGSCICCAWESRDQHPPSVLPREVTVLTIVVRRGRGEHSSGQLHGRQPERSRHGLIDGGAVFLGSSHQSVQSALTRVRPCRVLARTCLFPYSHSKQHRRGLLHTFAVHPTQPSFAAAGGSEGNLLFWDRRKPEYPLEVLQRHDSDGNILPSSAAVCFLTTCDLTPLSQ